MKCSSLALVVALAACVDGSEPGSAGSGPGIGGKADGQTVEIEVSARATVAKLVADVACIERFNSEGESTGPSVWFHSQSYGSVRVLENAGMTSRMLAGGATCRAEGGTLTYVAVGEYDSATEVNAAIMAAGGYTEALVLFWDQDALADALRASTADALDSIQ